jgi:hypothetical protein
MDGQRARLVTRTLDRVPTIGRAAPDTTRSGLLAPAWAWVLGLGWPLAIVVGDSVQPAPADPDAAVPAIVTLATLVLFAALVGTAVAASQRHPSAAVWGVVTGLIAVGFAVGCPATGHHAIGGWWFGQLALSLAMLGASLAALGPRARQAT